MAHAGLKIDARYEGSCGPDSTRATKQPLRHLAQPLSWFSSLGGVRPSVLPQPKKLSREAAGTTPPFDILARTRVSL
jgi:hypothetical protein